MQPTKRISAAEKKEKQEAMAAAKKQGSYKKCNALKDFYLYDSIYSRWFSNA